MTPDVVVIGAGPAGMSVAGVLARAGASVLVVDEQPAAGGQIYRAVEKVSAGQPEFLALLGEDYSRGAGIVEAFRQAAVAFAPGTSVWDIEGGQHPRVGLVGDNRARMVMPRHIVIATGAMERPAPFPGWTLPGVMTVGAAQTLLKESGLVPRGRVVIAGSGPLVLLYARQVIDAGAVPDTILDTGPQGVPIELWPRLARSLAADAAALFKGLRWQRELKRAGANRLCNVESIRAVGDQRIEAVEYVRNGQSHRLVADLLLVHDGVIPNTHLTMAAGCQHRWRELQHCWAPELDASGASSIEGISVAGDGGGIAGADAAVVSGRLVGLDVARRLGLVSDAQCRERSVAERERLSKLAPLRDFLDRQYPPLASFQVPEDDDTVVCRCEEVTVRQIREVAAMGCMGPNQGKAFTRCGMGPCMGRKCGNTVSQLFADCHDLPVSEIGHYRIRPPVRPLTVGQLADLDHDFDRGA